MGHATITTLAIRVCSAALATESQKFGQLDWLYWERHDPMLPPTLPAAKGHQQAVPWTQAAMGQKGLQHGIDLAIWWVRPVTISRCRQAPAGRYPFFATGGMERHRSEEASDCHYGGMAAAACALMPHLSDLSLGRGCTVLVNTQVSRAHPKLRCCQHHLRR